MRVLKYVVALLALVLSAGSAAAQQIPRIAYINSDKIIAESKQAQAAQQSFEQELSRYREEVNQMGAALERMVQDYDTQKNTMTPQARTAKENDIRMRQTEYESRLRELESQAAERRQALVEPVMDKINEVIDSIRREGNYALILDASSTAIIAADPALDLTEEVLRRLSAEAEQDDAPGA
ncbi:MAG: OmpH family outer membrane protein [Gemmatimonadota bacterium]|nr:OmpH family outer membrane protein [Gemmatimonadota bacterium]